MFSPTITTWSNSFAANWEKAGSVIRVACIIDRTARAVNAFDALGDAGIVWIGARK
jgi:hypothetical protein